MIQVYPRSDPGATRVLEEVAPEPIGVFVRLAGVEGV
jgi:hypothetical protein